MFTSQQWKHLSNDFLKSQQEKRHSWFKATGTIKKFRAGLSIFSPIPKYVLLQELIVSNRLVLSKLLLYLLDYLCLFILSSPRVL